MHVSSFGSVSGKNIWHQTRPVSLSHTVQPFEDLRVLSDGRVEMETRGFQEKADDGPHMAARCRLRHTTEWVTTCSLGCKALHKDAMANTTDVRARRAIATFVLLKV